MTNTVIAMFAGVSLVIACSLVTLSLSLHSDYTEYNKGKCTKCGHKLRYCYKTIYGDRTYVCDKCKHIVTISWKCVDKKERSLK